MSEEAFKEKVERLSDRMNDVMSMSKDAVVTYLKAEAGWSVRRGKAFAKIPEVRNGNLIRKIAQGKLDSKPKYRKVGSVLVATFKGWYALDNNGSGSHTVTTSDGRNAPYASYLNYSKRFSSYNGFFDLAKDTYRQSLIDNFEDSYNHSFEKKYRY
jgi:hypothetical protein